MLTAAIAAVAVASAGSAYMTYQGTQTQAAMGRAQARASEQAAQLQLEMTRTQRLSLENQAQMSSLEAIQQETERRRRAMGADDANSALAAFAGIAGDSPTMMTLAAENRRMLQDDVGAIRLLGQGRGIQIAGQQTASAAQAYGLEVQGRFARAEGAVFAAQGRNSWIRPSLSLLGTAGNLYTAGAFSSKPGGTAMNDTNSMFGDPR